MISEAMAWLETPDGTPCLVGICAFVCGFSVFFFDLLDLGGKRREKR